VAREKERRTNSQPERREREIAPGKTDADFEAIDFSRD